MIPVNKLKKKELVYLATHYCEHHHTYIDHYNCFLKDKVGDHERVGFLDIEASNLSADFGIVFSVCVKEYGGMIHERLLNARDLRRCLDKEVVRGAIEDMRKFDRIVTYYGMNGRYDIPYLRSRALYHRLNFPPYGELTTTDCYDMVKRKLKLSRNRMVNAADFLGIPAKQHPLLGEVWFKAMRGDRTALQYILKHNREDVETLEQLYKTLFPFTRITDLSL